MEKIEVRQMEELNATNDIPIFTPVVSPLWELLALFGLIGTIASGPGIAAALMLLLHWLRGK